LIYAYGNQNSDTKIPAESEIDIPINNTFYDPFGIIDTGNNQFKVPVKGEYELEITFTVSGISDNGARVRVDPLVNGNRLNGFEQRWGNSGSFGADVISTTAGEPIKLNAGDTVNFKAFCSNSSDTTFRGGDSDANRNNKVKLKATEIT